MFHLKTVSDDLRTLIQMVSAQTELADFRLVGGTALSLYLGHRISVDADFFTDHSFDKHTVEQALLRHLPGIMKIQEANLGFTWVYRQIKIDFYDWKVPFLKPPVVEQNMRLASLEDIGAYKLDAVVGRKTEKDFRDVAELLTQFTLGQLIDLYRRKYPHNNVKLVLDHLAAVQYIQPDETLILVKETPWKTVEKSIVTAVSNYVDDLLTQKKQSDNERDQRIAALLAQKNKPT